MGDNIESEADGMLRLHEHGSAFSTRARAVELAEHVHVMATDTDQVDVDFSGVLSISYSFADEFVGELTALISAYSRPRLAFVGLTPEVGRVVRRCFANRGLDDAVLHARVGC